MDRHKYHKVHCMLDWRANQWRIQTFRYGRGGGGGHSDPEINGPHFGLRMRGGGGGPPGPLPRIRHCALNEAI